MTTPTLSDSMIKMLQPSEYDGKGTVGALAFLARASTFYTILPSTMPTVMKFMMILNCLKDDAANWAQPYYTLLSASPPCWADWDAFAKDFKAHFCAVDDRAAAYNELRQLNRKAQRPRMDQVQDWTAKFNAAAARTELGDVDKRQRYMEGLPSELQTSLVTSGRTIDTLPELQAAALTVSQQLATIKANQFQPFKHKGKEQVNAAGTSAPKETRTCYKCGQVGHISRNCKAKKVAATAETDALKAQIKELQVPVRLRDHRVHDQGVVQRLP